MPDKYSKLVECTPDRNSTASAIPQSSESSKCVLIVVCDTNQNHNCLDSRWKDMSLSLETAQANI